MRTASRPLIILLSIFSFLPFILATGLSITGVTFLGKTGIELFVLYSAIILSFLSGMTWGQILESPVKKSGRKILISGSLLTFAAWFSLLLDIPELSIAILLLGFVSIFWVEARWLKLLSIPQSYYSRMRFTLTALVCTLHLFVLFPYH